MTQNRYKTMGIFPRDSYQKYDGLIDFLSVVHNQGPQLRDVINEYEHIIPDYDSIDGLSLERLTAMGVIKIDQEKIELTELGDEIRLEDKNTLAKLLSNTFVGFYDTIAILSKASVRISTLKSFLNELHDVNWSANNEPKRRVDWLRDMELAHMNDANEYSLTEAGETVFEELLQSWGSPPASGLFTAADSEAKPESAPDQSSSGSVSADTGGPDDERRTGPEISVIDRDTKKLFSFHVNKTDEMIEDYRENVQEDTDIDSVDWVDDEIFAGSVIRYWEIDEGRFQNIETLTRGDCILFHHHDDGYMDIARVLTTQEVTEDGEQNDWFIVFEEIREAEISREVVFEIYDCEVHPKDTWIRIDDEGMFPERYDSVTDFFDEAGGTKSYEYWHHDYWDLDKGKTYKLERQLQRKNRLLFTGLREPERHFMPKNLQSGGLENRKGHLQPSSRPNQSLSTLRIHMRIL